MLRTLCAMSCRLQTAGSGADLLFSIVIVLAETQTPSHSTSASCATSVFVVDVVTLVLYGKRT